MSGYLSATHNALYLGGQSLYTDMLGKVRANAAQLPRVVPEGYDLYFEEGHSPPAQFESGENPMNVDESCIGALLRHSPALPPFYINLVATSGRFIFCQENFAAQDPLSRTPGRFFWTEYMANAYQRVMIDHGGSPTSLEQVWRVSIANDFTRGAMTAIYIKHEVGTKRAFAELRTDDPGFFVLLGSDNGKGVARMLGDYPQLFGQRVVVGVRVYRTELC